MSAQIKRARATSQGGLGRQVRGGDPGLFGTLGGIIGSVIPGVGTAVGGALGTAADALFGGGRSRPSPAPVAAPIMPQGGGRITQTQYPFLGGAFGGTKTQVSRPFGPQTGPVTTGTVTQEIGCPSGYHPNKSGYYTQSEGWIPKGTKCVKNRRRNPANPRALDRALGRLNSAKRLQSKMSKYSTDKYTASGRRKDKC